MKIIFGGLAVIFITTVGKPSAGFAQSPARVEDSTAVYRVKGIRFSYKAGGPVRGVPALYNGVLYFGCGDGYLYALGCQGGELRWRFKTRGAVYSSPYVSGGVVYFTSRDGCLYAVNADGGIQLWKFQMGRDLGDENYWDNYISSPVLNGNILYVGSGDGHLYAIDKTAGKLVWKYDAGARIRVTPAIFEDHIIFGDNAGLIIDVNRITGKMQWQFRTDGAGNSFESKSNDRKSIFCSPAISDGVVVSGGRDGIIYALDLVSGRQRWRNDHKGPWILSAAIKDGVVFVGCGSDALVQALDLKSGAEKWKFKAPSAVFSSIAMAGDMLYFNDLHFSGNVHAVDSRTGVEKWVFPMGCRSFSTPVVGKGIVYTAAENGMLYALEGEPSGPDSAGDAGTQGAAGKPKKFVYWQGKVNDHDYTDFQNGVDQYLRDYFVAAGYKLVNEKELAGLMREQLSNRSKTVIVFADNRFPREIVDGRSGKPLVLQYLEAGGKVALFGLNPIAYTRDSVGAVVSYDDSIPSVIFGLTYPAKNFIRGIYEDHITAAGKKAGLLSSYTTVSNFTVIRPGAGTTVLATDEFGSCTEWIKNFGGAEGTGLLQLNIPAGEVNFSMAEIRAVIEWGVTWG
jgi:eukaryotic-like serine/threonine-protein kinase